MEHLNHPRRKTQAAHALVISTWNSGGKNLRTSKLNRNDIEPAVTVTRHCRKLHAKLIEEVPQNKRSIPGLECSRL